ncbi:MAG: hypothetical protein HY824_12620 [Acidobacteria bacterium]|nr:hypothetical protein [Acidobacteriota bacterium]
MSAYTIGDRVSQPQYGHGTVTAADDRHTVIDFDEHGCRMFATRLVRLERSSTMAPPKPVKARRRTTAKPAR